MNFLQSSSDVGEYLFCRRFFELVFTYALISLVRRSMSRQFLQVEIRDRDREILSVVQSKHEGRGRSGEKLSVAQSVDDGREQRQRQRQRGPETDRKKLKSAKFCPRAKGSEKSKQIERPPVHKTSKRNRSVDTRPTIRKRQDFETRTLFPSKNQTVHGTHNENPRHRHHQSPERSYRRPVASASANPPAALDLCFHGS